MMPTLCIFDNRLLDMIRIYRIYGNRHTSIDKTEQAISSKIFMIYRTYCYEVSFKQKSQY